MAAFVPKALCCRIVAGALPLPALACSATLDWHRASTKASFNTGIRMGTDQQASKEVPKAIVDLVDAFGEDVRCEAKRAQEREEVRCVGLFLATMGSL